MAWWKLGGPSVGERTAHLEKMLHVAPPSGSVAARMIPVWQQGKPLPQPRDFKKFADEGYRLNSIIHACVQEIASSAAEPRLIVEQNQSGEWVEVEDTGAEVADGELALLRLFDNPNREQSQFEFLENLVTYLMVMGNDFVHKVRSGRGVPVELWHLRPDRMKIVPGADGIVESYRLGSSGLTDKPIKAEDVTHIQARPDPIDDYWGLSPIVACARAADVDDQVLDYIRAFFENAGTPAGILTLKTQVHKDERDRILEMWRDRQTGPEGWHGLAVLDADAEFQNVGAAPGQLKIDFIFDSSESRICSVFGVPPIIVGTRIGLIRSTFANYREARRSFWRETLSPLYARIADKLTHGVATEFGDDLRVRFDLTGIEELQESHETKRAHAMQAWDKGVMTLNEARLMIELEELPDGDILKRRTQDIFTPIDQLAVEEEPEDIVEKDPEDDIDAIQAEAERQMIQPANRPREKAATPLFVDVPAPEPEWKAIHKVADSKHGRFRAAFLKNRGLIVGPEIQQAVEAGFVEGNLTLVELAVNWKSVEAPMAEAFEGAIAETMAAAAKASEAHLPPNVNLQFDITNPFAVEFAKEHSFNLVRQIGDDSIAGLQRVIRAAFEEGLPPRVAAKRIMDTVGLTKLQTQAVDSFRAKQLALGVEADAAEASTSKFAQKVLRRRATLIARTETIRASAMGQQALWDQAIGAKLLPREQQREWIITPDDRLDEKQCLPMAGQVKGMGEPFVTGTGAEFMTPPIHPGCRCAIALFFPDN